MTPIAIIREQLEDNRAVIEWLYNPVPDGEELAWPAGEGDAPPIDMVLHCPACGLQHIDAPVPCTARICESGCVQPEDCTGWTNPPHRSHLCHGCGHVWRPADVPTNGVQAVKTKGQGDSPLRYVIAARVDRIQDAFTQRLERQRRTGDVKGATATQSAIDLIRSTP